MPPGARQLWRKQHVAVCKCVRYLQLRLLSFTRGCLPLLGKSVAMPCPLLASDPISASLGGLTRANTRMLPFSSCVTRKQAHACRRQLSVTPAMCHCYADIVRGAAMSHGQLATLVCLLLLFMIICALQLTPANKQRKVTLAGASCLKALHALACAHACAANPHLDGVVQLAPDQLTLVHAAFSICQAGLQAGQLDLQIKTTAPKLCS